MRVVEVIRFMETNLHFERNFLHASHDSYPLKEIKKLFLIILTFQDILYFDQCPPSRPLTSTEKMDKNYMKCSL